jgi:hypothetical protein
MEFNLVFKGLMCLWFSEPLKVCSEPWWGQVIPKHTISSLSKVREGKHHEDEIDSEV